MTLSPSPSAPATARTAVGALLGRCDRTDDVQLIASELVTNAVAHGCNKPVAFTVNVFDDFARIEVRSHTRSGVGRRNLERRQRGDAGGGFGLNIVDALSDRWGVNEGPPLTIWSEVALSASR